MKKIAAILSLLTITSTTFAFTGSCIYTDNKVAPGKPNGSILTIGVNVQNNESQKIINLSESSDILQASLSVSGDMKQLIVTDVDGKILANKTSSLDSGTNFLISVKTGFLETAQASLVCLPNQ